MRGIKRIAGTAIAVGVLAAAGCGGGDKPVGSASSSNNSSSSASNGAGQFKKGGTVTIANVGGQTWSCQFNPFNPAVNQEALGFVYEPLTFVNVLKAGATTPMLATDFTWSPAKDSIVFTIRDGVKWSDGQPFSADDVVYTFNLMKQQPALDLYALWTGAGLTSVTAAGNKVTMKFKGAAEPYFFNFANQVGIVPKHIWSTGEAASKPATWANPKPVGTGAYTVESCSSNNITYAANGSYWQPGKPYIQKVQYPAYLDNNPANLDLASGKAQWGGQYIPNIDNFYKSKSPDNNYWFPPTANVALVPNNDPSRPATSKLAVRQALAYALDREQISKIGESGYQPAANQSGVVTPTFDKYFDQGALTAAGYGKANTDKAKQLLQSAGYSSSNPLKLSVITVTGYTDWDASLAVVKQQLAAVGVELSIQDLQQQSYNQKLYTGDYDLAYSSQTGGPTPYYELRQLLYSKNTAPIGKQANSNYSRYINPEVDKLLDQYASADPDTQVKLVKQISGYMIKDVPVIPTTESVDWYQYNTTDLQGWPTQDDPYAQPAPYNMPDVGQVLTNLYSKSAQK
jgi:peptide/nickel transport system substrate-binding protein